MLHGFFNLIALIIGGAGALFGFGLAREFVRQRLRYVDAVKSPLAPWAVFLGTLLVAIPIVAILPIVGGGTALLLSAGTGLGTASGVKALKQGD